MIEILWPWAFSVLPLPLLMYILLPRFEQRDTALYVPFYRSATSFDAQQLATARRNLWQRFFTHFMLARARRCRCSTTIYWRSC